MQKTTLEKRWSIIESNDSKLTKELASQLGVSSFIAQLLIQRGITTFNEAKSFFRPTLTELHDPFLMKDMDKAVNRVLDAIENNEKILVYGDYDVDGTTAVALMYSFLKAIYDKLEYYIPNRYTEGYGVSFQGIDYAHENNFSLIIALDCGIKAIDKVDYANEKNIDFIICDHHRPGDELPNAAAVLDPKRNDCEYPYKELCGCGVGFKLVQAIATTKNIPFSELEQYFDLLAISIASDIVPITGENRVLAHFGLNRVNENPRKGIAEILKLSKNNKELNITGLVFTIGPRINAAGRMQSGMNAVKLLVSNDDFDSQELSKFIEQENADRKDLDRNITEEALDLVASNEALVNAKSSVLYNKDWHKGVIGIVASRLIENYYRPTIILTESNGVAAGSARSVLGFDVYNAIDACSDLLTQFGGHMYAAGLTMPIENIPAFQQKFEEVVSQTITPDQLIPEIKIDAKIDFNEIKSSFDYGLPKFYRVLKQFAPFGPQNMTPNFMTEKVVAKWVKIVGETHLKFTAYQESNPTNVFPCIAFGMSDFYSELASGKEFSFVYNLEENTWNNNTSLQLMVRDIKVD